MGNIKAGPLENEHRSCKDICCIVTFFLLIVAFGVIGIYMMIDEQEVFTQ